MSLLSAGDFLSFGEKLTGIHAVADGRNESVIDHLKSMCEAIGEELRGDDNIVYVVLNHTRSDTLRYFVAWLSRHAVVPDELKGVKGSRKGNFTDVVAAKEHVDQRAVASAWMENWRQYDDLTHDLNSPQNNRFTWNNFILRRATRPRTMGMLFEPARQSVRPAACYRPMMSLAVELTRSGPDTIMRVSKGLRCDERLVEDIRQSTQSDEVSEPHGVASTMALALRAYYGDWGGSAFVSIPVASDPPGRGTVSVLSICSINPLSESELVGWSYIAGRLLAPVTRRVVREVARTDVSFGDFYYGNCPRTADAVRTATTVATTAAPVLIVAETGTGKGLLAKHVHDLSGRRGKFVKVNCGEIAAPLFESEVFGHERGAFTGATTQRKGLFAASNEGTLFLDEIGELPLEMQAKLLGVLDTQGEVRRVGSDVTERFNVRIVAATNVDLAEAVRQKRFRSDLYYRINCVHITLPPLRERPLEHFAFLLNFLLRKYAEKYGRHGLELDAPAIQALHTSSRWPGNVRQLEHCVARAVALQPDAGKLRIEPPVDPEPDLAVFDDVAAQLFDWVRRRTEPVMLQDLWPITETRLLERARRHCDGWRGVESLLVLERGDNYSQRYKGSLEKAAKVRGRLSAGLGKVSGS